MFTGEMKDWLLRSNETALTLIARQGRPTLGVVPFLGAGVSMTFGFPSWQAFLHQAAPPALRSGIEELLNEQDFESAAQALLDELGSDGFQNLGIVAAGDNPLIQPGPFHRHRIFASFASFAG